MSTQKDSVTVFGLGYVGLPTAAFLASTGIEVRGVDTDPVKVSQINSGSVPFVEPGFEKLLKSVVSEEMLVAANTPRPSQAFIIAVPTPLDKGRRIDDSYVMSAVAALTPLLEGDELIVLESTSTPGLTEKIGNSIVRDRRDLTLEPNQSNSIYLVHAPERVLPGKIMDEMTGNNRILGGLNEESSVRASQLYSRFTDGRILTTDARTAELTKLTENAYRDVNIAFANELSIICEDLGINIWELIKLANQHPRVNILQPGPGVGGHCIAIDPWFIVESSPTRSRLIKTAREVNDSKPNFIIEKARSTISTQRKSGQTPTIAILGISFKPDIDDLRESPALQILKILASEFPDVEIYVVEPNIECLPHEIEQFENVILTNLEIAIQQSSLTLLLVDHKEFKLNKARILQARSLIDTRGITHTP